MRLFVLAVSVLFLAGCAELPAGQDLGKAIADARATQSAAQAQMRATEKADQRQRGEATMAAAQTQGAVQAEIDLLRARIDATQQAIDIEGQRAQLTEAASQVKATETAAAILAAGTAQARNLQATTIASQGYATQTAVAISMVRAVSDAARDERTAKVMWYVRTFGPAAVLIVLAGVIIAVLLVYLPQFIRMRLIQLDRPTRFQETRAGSVYLIGEQPYLVGQSPTVGLKLPAGPGAQTVTALTPSRSVLSSPMPLSIRDMTISLLKTAVMINGKGHNQLPRWDKLGWSPRPTRRVIAALVAAGALIVESGRGSYVADEYQTLGNLLFEIETNHLELPSPTSVEEDNED